MNILDLRNNKRNEPKGPSIKQTRRPYRLTAILLGFAIIAFVALNVVFAWTNPALAPPGGGGALVVTSGAPSSSVVIGATGTITTGIWQAAAIADAYLAGIAGTKVSGNINGNAANVTGTVGVVNGGTGATTLSGLLLGNGTGSFTALIGSTANDVLTWSGTNWISQAPTSGASSSIVFSNGSDGDVTIASSQPLSRDWHYNNLTVNGGVTLNTNGYRILVKGTLTNNGIIENSGGAGGTLQAGGAAGSAGASGGGGAGCSSGCSAGGTAGASRNPSLGSSGGSGGNGNGCGNAGGAGLATSEQAQIIKQVIPTSTNVPSGIETVVTSVGDLNYLLASGATSGINLSASGGGGGGGCGSGFDAGVGGGGGAGGGIVFISAQTLANNGTIQANGNGGGTGGNGYAGGAFPGGGGGGGGGGGVVILFYKTLNNLGTITVNGGGGGAGGSSGGGAGAAGTVGKIYRALISF